MTELRIKFLAVYAVAVVTAYLLKKIIFKKSTKAIEEKRLSIGIYRFFPVEGEQAVRLAQA